MAAALNNRKGNLYLLISFSVFYAILFQVQPAGCDTDPILKLIRQALPRVDHQTISSLEPDETVYSPKTPFLGELTENLSVGSIIRIYGYIPENLKRFDVNLCADCAEGPMHFHLSVRFDPQDIVRNSYGFRSGWLYEERDSPQIFPFRQGQEFILQIEVNVEDYSISVDGHQTWKFTHRFPYASVDKLEIVGDILIWKVEYTDKSHQTVNQYLVEGDATSGLSIDVKANPASMFEKFTMDLKCECVPQSSSRGGS